MYLYSLKLFSRNDRIFVARLGQKFKSGDLIELDGNYFIVIGDKISFQEIYNYPLKYINKPNLLYTSFFCENTIKLINWMVYYYYTSYKSVMKMFVPTDLDKLLQREIENRKPRSKQTLKIFPDIWSILNSDDFENNNKDFLFLNSKISPKQKDIAWWKIKKGLIKNVVCTHSEIFQDWLNLSKIIFVQPHKRYYKNHQDPRYKVSSVVEKLAQIHNCEVEIID